MKNVIILKQIDELTESRQRTLKCIEEARMHHSIKESVNFMVDKDAYFGYTVDFTELTPVDKKYAGVRIKRAEIMIQDYNDKYFAFVKKWNSMDIVDRREAFKVLHNKTKQQYKEVVENNMKTLSKVEDIGNVSYENFDVKKIPDKVRYSLTSIKLLQFFLNAENTLIKNLEDMAEEKNVCIK